MRRFGLILLLGAVLASQPVPGAAAPAVETEEGFRLLYELRFEQARSKFLSWQAAHPGDALGYAWLAASYLFEEFYVQGVLTSKFFLDDKKLLGGIRGRPNEERGSAFRAAAMKAEELARQQLRIDSRNSEALLALAVTAGMRPTTPD